MSPYATELASARLDALRTLIDALNEAETPDEKRRCAVAIFNAPDPCDLDDEIELEEDDETDEADENEENDESEADDDSEDEDAGEEPTDGDAAQSESSSKSNEHPHGPSAVHLYESHAPPRSQRTPIVSTAPPLIRSADHAPQVCAPGSPGGGWPHRGVPPPSELWPKAVPVTLAPRITFGAKPPKVMAR